MFPAEKVKERMKELGISYWSDLGTKVGVSKSYLIEIKNHKIHPSLKVLQKISETLDLPMSLLLGDVDNFVQCECREGYGKANKVSKLSLAFESMIRELIYCEPDLAVGILETRARWGSYSEKDKSIIAQKLGNVFSSTVTHI